VEPEAREEAQVAGTRGGTGAALVVAVTILLLIIQQLALQPAAEIVRIPAFGFDQSANSGCAGRGNGRFTIFNTNDLLGGLERIGREQNEFYILGYVPSDTPEGSCHTLKVKLIVADSTCARGADIATRDLQRA